MTAATAIDFRTAAGIYAERGIAAHPLVLDPDGLPKRPKLRGYKWFKPAENLEHDWNGAAGLGLILGPASGNLAVIDVDDAGLAEHLLRYLSARPAPPLMASTARGRLHIYVVEPAASWSTDIEASYQNRWCPVQLLAKGSPGQVAAVPTPGYRWIDPKAQPFYDSLGGLWHRLAVELNLYYRRDRGLPPGRWSRKSP